MKKVHLLLFLFLPTFLIGQIIKLPDIIKPSPQAGEMTKYIDYPMDLSSGLASTTIPIYTVDSGNLSFPITISYHGSGFKPNDDESGVIGLGWNLNAFGIINRSINKYPDENYWNLMIPLKENIQGTSTSVLVEDADVPLLSSIAIHDRDTSPDIFSYSLPNGEGGKFVYGRNTVLSEFKKAILLPYKPIKVVSYPIDASTLDYYEIVDENGTTYRFGKSIDNVQIVKEYFANVSNSSQQGSGITSWLLTEIISANKKDVISFEYDDVKGKLNSNFIEKYNVQYNTNVSLGTYHTGPGEYQCVQNSIQDGIEYNCNQYTQKKITKIIFNSGYVKFSYKSNLYPDHLLDKIEVFSNGAVNPLKTFKFNQTKYQNASTSASAKYWYKLDEIGFYDAGNTKVNKYNFEYNTASFPFIDVSGNASPGWLVNTSSIDFWGFYNGASNSNLLPNNYIWSGMWGTRNLFGNANRSGNYLFAQQGVLKKIIFPTGGERSFIYEDNKNSSGEIVGGLRVKSIINKTNEKEIKRTYSYTGVSRALDVYYFEKHSMNSVQNPMGCNYSTNEFIASSSPNVDININGRPIIYSKVVEYDGDAILNNGRIEHLFDTSILQIYPKLYLRSLSPPYFPWNYSFYSNPLSIFYYDVIFGNIFEKETNFYNVSGDKVKSIMKSYKHSLKQNLKGFYCSPLVNYSSSASNRKSGAFNFYNYDIQQLSQKLDSTVTIEYSGATGIKSKEEYVYNDDLFVTQKTSSASNGSISNFQYKYPKDLAAQSPYNQMVVKNIIAPVIEETKSFKENQTQPLKVLSTTKNLYKDWGNENILPEFIQYSKGTGILESRIQYYGYYDNGNVKEISLTDGSHIVYFWGYSKEQPIAKIENATYSQIATALGVTTAVLDTYSETNLTTINNLRTLLTSAMVTTYTYVPLVGIKTITDPKGLVTYYEYDNFNRLQFVKDQNSNVLQRYCYNYLGQQTDCNIGTATVTTYKNVFKSQSFTKQACAAGSVGSSVVYSVPAGIYSSTVSQAAADALASAEITANGQSFANATGTCSTPLAAPTGLTFTSATASTINFSWTAVPGATSYKIYKGGELMGSVTTTTGSLSQLNALTSYSVQVSASNGVVDSALCSSLSMSTLPGVPTGLVLTSATASTLNFSWTAVSGVTDYKIYQNGNYMGTVNTTSGSLSGLAASTAYSIQVLATKGSVDGALCLSVSMSTTAALATDACSLVFDRLSGSCTLYKNNTWYLSRSTSGTSTGTLTAGDTFYVEINDVIQHSRTLTITSSVRGVLANIYVESSTNPSTPTITRSGTFTKVGSEVITIQCATRQD